MVGGRESIDATFDAAQSGLVGGSMTFAGQGDVFVRVHGKRRRGTRKIGQKNATRVKIDEGEKLGVTIGTMGQSRREDRQRYLISEREACASSRLCLGTGCEKIESV